MCRSRKPFEVKKAKKKKENKEIKTYLSLTIFFLAISPCVLYVSFQADLPQLKMLR